MTEPKTDPGLPRKPLRIALLQAAAAPGEVAANAAHAADLVSQAASGGARLVILPELYSSAYDLSTIERQPESCSLRIDASGVLDATPIEPLWESARSTKTTVLFGTSTRDNDGRQWNSLVALNDNASVAYHKHHLWHADEAKLFTPSNRPGFLELDGWRLGLGICYDMSFPEHARAMAVAGAHGYVCPSAFAAGREHRAGIYMAARALENTIYSVFVNSVDGPADRPSSGGSVVFGPDGTPVAAAEPTETEQVVFADLNPGRIASTRSFLRMLEEHRADLDH